MTIQIFDIDFDTLCKKEYEISIFASGYETRYTFIHRQIDPTMIQNPLVLGFTEEPHSGNRKSNDQYYLNRWTSPVILSSDGDKLIYDFLNVHTKSIESPIHIVIDYSSMSRLWYATVLNWARIAADGKEVVIDFIYSTGAYEEEDQPMVIRSMTSIPGCEGRAWRLRESVAIFGLGFHGLATLAVHELLEADKIYAFLASPGSSAEAVTKCKSINKAIIKDPKMDAVLDIPLTSVETCYRFLAETSAPHRPDGEITLVPMGPKPHILASILVAMRFQEVACLRVSGAPAPLDVKPTGDIVATRVIVKDDPQFEQN